MRQVIILGVVAVFILGLVAQGTYKVRQAADRMRCTNNLRQLGLTLHNYAGTYNDRLPPATMPNPNLKPEERFSWLVAVVPYVESSPLYKDIMKHEKDGWNSREVLNVAGGDYKPFTCPSCPSYGRTRATDLAPTTYPGLSGLGDDSAFLPLDDPRAGMFGHDRQLNLVDLRKQNSGTKPLVVVETSTSLGPWIAGGPATIRSLDVNARPYLGVGHPFGGYHGDGGNALFLEGNVVYLHQSVDPEVFEALVTIKVGAAAQGFDEN